MPFDPKRPHGYSSNTGVVRQDGKWYRLADGAEVDEDGNPTTDTSPEAEAAEVLATVAITKVTEKPEVTDESPEPGADTGPDLDVGYIDRLAALKPLRATKLKSMAKDVMAALDEDGTPYEVPQMSGTGVAKVLREFIAAHTD